MYWFIHKVFYTFEKCCDVDYSHSYSLLVGSALDKTSCEVLHSSSVSFEHVTLRSTVIPKKQGLEIVIFKELDMNDRI